jgi:alkylated DNA nucleotide flippase Atl1
MSETRFTLEDVYGYITDSLNQGRQPTYQDINEHFGITTAAYHVTTLLNRGRLGRTGRWLLYVPQAGDVIADPEFARLYPQAVEEIITLRQRLADLESEDCIVVSLP